MMKFPDWMRGDIHLSPSVKRDSFLLLALYIINLFFFSSWFQLSHVVNRPWLILVWLYGLVMLVPLFWRDRAPVTVFIIQLVLTMATWPIMSRYTPVVGVPFALYAVAVNRGRKTSLLSLFLALIPIVFEAATLARLYVTTDQQIQMFIGNFIFLGIVTSLAWGAGRAAQVRLQHVQRLESERETVREAVAAERSRIARELHDIVSHAVTAIVLQAAGASRVANTNFAQVTQSLANIETTGKQAMAELRRLLGVLEASGSIDQSSDVDELGPQPGLADITRLLDSLRDAGMPVNVHVEGTPHNLDASIDLAAYRIVQEGLTNVLKHAGMDSHPHLRLVWEVRSLLIQIDNDINVVEADRGRALSVGRGLVGLRARAHAAGGRLHAGPHHHGGYRLTAVLPLPDTAQRGYSLITAEKASQGSGGQGRVSA
jgi:signal transduction histidine kinase